MVLEIGRRGMQEPDVCSKLHNKILLRKKKGSKNFLDALSLAENYSEKEDRQCHWALGSAQKRSKSEANKHHKILHYLYVMAI